MRIPVDEELERIRMNRTKAKTSIMNAYELLEKAMAEIDSGYKPGVILERVNSAMVDLEDARRELTPLKKDSQAQSE